MDRHGESLTMAICIRRKTTTRYAGELIKGKYRVAPPGGAAHNKFAVSEPLKRLKALLY